MTETHDTFVSFAFVTLRCMRLVSWEKAEVVQRSMSKKHCLEFVYTMQIHC